jgi:hypothetical protein
MGKKRDTYRVWGTKPEGKNLFEDLAIAVNINYNTF